MNKPILIISGVIGVFVLAALLLHVLPADGQSALGEGHFSHAKAEPGDDTVTIKLNEPGFARCGQGFFDSVYELTKNVFSVGVENVVLSDYENRMFDLIRNSEEFKDDPEPFIDHIKAIPGQTIEIVKEDPQVLDSCENFEVAMVGPQ